MSFLSSLAAVFGGISKYGPIAIEAVQRAEQDIAGQGKGQTRKQLAVAYVLAGAHAGETVGVPVVAEVAGAVEMAASIANALGLFGKPSTDPVVNVPVAASAAVAK